MGDKKKNNSLISYVTAFSVVVILAFYIIGYLQKVQDDKFIFKSTLVDSLIINKHSECYSPGYRYYYITVKYKNLQNDIEDGNLYDIVQTGQKLQVILRQKFTHDKKLVNEELLPRNN